MSAQIVIRLPEEKKTSLELAATAMNTTMTDLVTQGIELVLAKFQKKHRNSLYELALFAEELAKDKKYPSYNPPISENIDRYLYGDLSPKWGHLYKTQKKKKVDAK